MKVPFDQNPQYLPPKHDEPPLHRAARLGDHARIREVIASGGNVDQPFDMALDPGGREALASPLMVASGSGDGATIDTMRLLLELGANPSLKFQCGSIARYAAAGLGWNYLPGGDAGRLALCLDLGCDPNETDARGVTLLADAAATGDIERVEMLLGAGAAANGDRSVIERALPSLKRSPFDPNAPFSFRIPLHNAVEADEVEMVDALIRAGADVHAVDECARTAIFCVRSTAVARRLVEAGATFELQDCLGWSPLVAAICDGSLEGVRALLSIGADVQATHDRGYTVFMSAVSSSERTVEIMQLLVDAGADPHAVSELGWNAFHAAIDVNGLEANREESIRSTFELLRQLGVDIDHRDHEGTSPLERARQRGTEAEVKVLLALGAS